MKPSVWSGGEERRGPAGKAGRGVLEGGAAQGDREEGGSTGPPVGSAPRGCAHTNALGAGGGGAKVGAGGAGGAGSGQCPSSGVGGTPCDPRVEDPCLEWAEDSPGHARQGLEVLLEWTGPKGQLGGSWAEVGQLRTMTWPSVGLGAASPR